MNLQQLRAKLELLGLHNNEALVMVMSENNEIFNIQDVVLELHANRNTGSTTVWLRAEDY